MLVRQICCASTLKIHAQNLSRWSAQLTLPKLVIISREHMHHHVFCPAYPPSCSSIPWQHASKVLHLHRLQPWDRLHHDVLRQIWKELLQFHRQGQVEIQYQRVHLFRLFEKGSHHSHFSKLMHLIPFKPLQNLPSIVQRHHRTSMLNLYIYLATFVISNGALVSSPLYGEVQLRQSSHWHNPSLWLRRF